MPERLAKLREMLQELEEELQSPDPMDAETRQLLEEAVSEIQAVLQQNDPSQLEPHSLGERLRESIQDFEVSHPTIAGVVSRIVDVLGQMGI